MKVLLGILFSAFLMFSATAANAQIVFGSDYTKAITPTVTAGAYSAGQAMGGLQKVTAFRDITVPFGIFDFFMISSRAGNTIGMTIYVFDTNPAASTCTDTSSFSLAAADQAKLAFNPFTMTPAVPQNGTGSTAENVSIHSVQNHDSPATQNLYFCIVANGSVTPGSTTDLSFKIGISQD